MQNTKLTQLRALMRQQNLDYYLILGADPHQSEYVAPYWQQRQFISDFTGSNGNVLVGLHQAYLWTDGRYTLQAKLEVDADAFTIFDYGKDAGIQDFLLDHAHHQRIGVDPTSLTHHYAEKLSQALSSIDAKLIFTAEHLVNSLWSARPSIQHSKAFVHPIKFAGETITSKLAKLRNFMHAQGLDALALNELTNIAWLFNIRGHDASDTPIILSYALLSAHTIHLYVAPASVTDPFKEYCEDHQVKLLPYEQFYDDLQKLRQLNIGVDLEANALMGALLQEHNNLKVLRLPLTLAKAQKNPQELEGMLAAHIEDGIALVRFFAWLEKHWQGQTEVTISDKLEIFRRAGPNFFSLSFPTIAGFKGHGAIIHYCAQAKSASKLTDDGLLLLDSGGQYLGGTTDVTRTIHLGAPSAFERTCYTRVLKGHLALRHTPFPQGTRGNQLDSLARQYLWQQGLDYAHGTGHGVGAFLNVHEGPQSVSSGALNTTPLMLNMTLSNEPGVYFENKFGIRIENVCYVKAFMPEKTQQNFYILEDLTLVPYCRKLIEVSLLSHDEINWLNAYHHHVFEMLNDQLDSEAQAWLQAATSPI